MLKNVNKTGKIVTKDSYVLVPRDV